MANKFFTKALSVGLSLSLCAGLVAPALAANFSELQEAIDGGAGTYGAASDIVRDDNNTITLNGSVEREENEKSITVDSGNITIDLNGHNIDGNDIKGHDCDGNGIEDNEVGSVILVTGDKTELTIKDSKGELKTETDAEGNVTRTLTSGKITGGNSIAEGGGIRVTGGADLTLDKVTVEGNQSRFAGGGIYADGERTAKTTVTITNSVITDNEAGMAGGGIHAEAGAIVTVDESEITENVGCGGNGVSAVSENTNVTLTDTNVTSNESKSGSGGSGGGISVRNGATVTMTNGSVSQNSASDGGGVYVGTDNYYYRDGVATFTANGTKIEENNASNSGGGIFVTSNKNVNLNGVAVKNNTSYSDGGGIYNIGGTVTVGDYIPDPDKDETIKSEISGNHVTRTNGGAVGGGVKIDTGTFRMMDKTLIYGNTVALSTLSTSDPYSHGVDIYKGSNGTLILFDIGKEDNVQRDGKTITGWRVEGYNNRWSEDRDDSQKVQSKYGKHEVVSGRWTNYYFWGNEKLEGFGENGTGTIEITEGISLIAAYDKYFDVNVANDDGTLVEGVKLMVERKDTVDGEVLDSIQRDGYKLEGWTLMDSAGNDLGKDGAVTGEDFTVVLKWHQHDFSGAGVVTKEPTCTEDGVRIVTCTCGETQEQTIPMTAHTPGEWTVVKPAQIGVPGLEHQLCKVCGVEVDTREIAALPTPPAPDTGDDGGDPEIGDQLIPLAAGPITRAEFLDYLWRHEGEPASDGVCTFTDVPEDHEFILALAWAEQNGIAKAYEDGAFEPDELVTVSAVRDFLGNFARVFGGNAVAVSALSTLTGEADEAVVNCDEVLAEFFGEAYVSAKDQDEKLAA